MEHMSAVRRFEAGDAPAAAAIIRGLPDYFTDDVPDKSVREAASHEAWVITDSGTVAGFAVVARKSPGTAHPATAPTRPPAPSGNATASSTSTRSTRCPAGRPATRPRST
jgi:hypothetical protein